MIDQSPFQKDELVIVFNEKYIIIKNYRKIYQKNMMNFKTNSDTELY